MKNLTSAISTDKPYTIKPVRSSWFGRTEFGIYFEDTCIRTTNMDYDSLTEVAILLNTAWMMGYSSGYIAGEVAEKV